MITRTTIERADGTRETQDALERGGFRGERIVAGTSRVLAVAPDPAGGQPWARARLQGRARRAPATPARAGWSATTSAASTPAWTSSTATSSSCSRNCGKKPPTAAHPLRVDTLIGGDALDSQGRVERRIIDGRIVYWGVVHPDVVSVTIITPRDIRTLVPTKDHVFVAAYAGLFPGGKATATAHLQGRAGGDARAARRVIGRWACRRT